MLTAIYTRSRHSDLRMIHRIIMDVDEIGGFVELQTKYHKCAKSNRKKTMLLPLLAPARGVDGSIWPPKVAAAFNSLPLALTLMGFSTNHCSGLWMVQVTSSSETNKFIELLFPGTSLSSHSCNCSYLGSKVWIIFA